MKFKKLILLGAAFVLLCGCGNEGGGTPSEQVAASPASQSASIHPIRASDVVSIWVEGGLPGMKGIRLSDLPSAQGQALIAKVSEWIDDAEPVGGQTEYGKHGYPKVASIAMIDGQTITIEPAYQCVIQRNPDGSGSKTCTPVDGEVVIRSLADGAVRARSQELYRWLETSAEQ